MTMNQIVEALVVLENASREPIDLELLAFARNQARTAISTLKPEGEQISYDSGQWWFKELEQFWGDSDHAVTLDTRRAVKIALDAFTARSSEGEQISGEAVERGARAIHAYGDEGSWEDCKNQFFWLRYSRVCLEAAIGGRHD